MEIISIVMPVFNEVSTIESAIQRVLDAATPGWKKQLVIVDDGSTDGTAEVLKRWEKHCTVLYQSKNKGKGAALARGFHEANGSLVLVQDADLEYSPTDYPVLLAPFLEPRVKVVYGSRFLGAHLSTMYVYAMGNKFVTLMTNILYNTNITDMETGYKVFRKEVLDRIGTLTARRFDFEPEVTAKLLRAGYQIYEVPISYYGRKFAEGKKLTWRDGVAALLTLIKLRFWSPKHLS